MRRGGCVRRARGALAVLVVTASLLAVGGSARGETRSPGLVPAVAAEGAPAVAISPARCRRNRAAGPITFLSPYSYDASAGIIDVYAAAALGYFTALCLDVVTVAAPPTAVNPVTLVSAGKGTVTGVGSAADTLVYLSHGVNITAIATYGDTSDYALATGPGIRSLTELEGKILGYKTTMPVVLTEMLQRAKVDLGKVREVAVTTYDPSILPENKVQALQVYQSNEPITLRADHDPYRLWTPAEFGVSGTFNVVVANRTFVASHPGPTADFLRAELHAFDFCAKNPVTCVDIEARLEGSSYPVAHSLDEWKLEASLALHHTLKGAGVGVESGPEWAPELAALRANGIVSSVPDLAAGLDTKLAASLYAGMYLLWPGG